MSLRKPRYTLVIRAAAPTIDDFDRTLAEIRRFLFTHGMKERHCCYDLHNTHYKYRVSRIKKFPEVKR